MRPNLRESQFCAARQSLKHGCLPALVLADPQLLPLAPAEEPDSLYEEWGSKVFTTKLAWDVYALTDTQGAVNTTMTSKCLALKLFHSSCTRACASYTPRSQPIPNNQQRPSWVESNGASFFGEMSDVCQVALVILSSNLSQ